MMVVNNTPHKVLFPGEGGIGGDALRYGRQIHVYIMSISMYIVYMYTHRMLKIT